MGDMYTHPNHVAQVLVDLVKKWWEVNPEAIRALEKFNRENKSVLVAEQGEKRKILAEIRLKAFKGTATGQRLDLSVYKQVFEPLNEEALEQKACLSKKGGL